MLKEHQAHVNINSDLLSASQTLILEKSNHEMTQVRQYKKDFDLTRKSLYKEQQDYAL